jgi:prolyl-tRNA synthetase
MRQSKLLLPTLREAPSDAEAKSHQLMLRAGLIRQLAAGIYTYLPLGWRVLKKVSDIVRQEMDYTKAQEILMPAMQPADLWQESGRYDIYGPELVRFKDRHEREFTLGPTHEEVVTTLIRNEINSYRQLPLHLYQIQTKFRDERRPRFGLLRGREFLMKDAYSFDMSWDGLDRTYWIMYEAYTRIFKRCGLNFRLVEADAGAIGGDGETHEFIALADIGEDMIGCCTNCDYSANLEKAESGSDVGSSDSCPRCKRPLQFSRGIEVGHIFKLGTKYSEKLGAKYLDPSGKEQVMIMGCYGIGVSRVLSAVVEQNNDPNGIIWPISIAPYHVHIIPVSIKDQSQMRLADELYSSLCNTGIEVLLDDRDERPGIKFKDSDLIGIPIRIIVGKQASEGIVEFKERSNMEQKEMRMQDAFLRVLDIMQK